MDGRRPARSDGRAGMRSRREFLKGVGIAAAGVGAVGLLEACTPASTTATPTPGASATPAPVKGGTLIEGGLGDVVVFNPLLERGGASSIVPRLLFSAMIDIDPNSNLVPMLAEAIPNPPDGKTFQFKLRADANWSDGRPISSEDVAFTFKILTDPAYKAFSSSKRGQAEAQIQSVATPDAKTVVITTKTSNASFLAILATLPIMPKHMLGTLSAEQLSTHEFNSAPSVVSGPFKFVRWDKGQQIRLARNDTHFRGAPLLDGYVYKTMPDDNVTATQLRLGEIDMGRVITTQVAQFTNNAEVQLLRDTAAAWTVYTGIMDPEFPAGRIFSDKAVRQAMRWAIDVESMKKAAYQDEGEIMTTHYPSWSWAHDKSPQIKYGYDPAKARQMLDAAGWKVGSSGVREKGGTPLKFTISVGSGIAPSEIISQILQQQWKAVGMDPEVKVVNSSQLVSDVVAKRAYDVWVATLSQGGQDPDGLLVYHDSAGAKLGGFNIPNYKNARVDQLFAEARAIADQPKRAALYKEIQAILLDELPWVPLVLPIATTGLRKRVNGIAKMGLFAGSGHRPWMKDVWVSDGK